MEFFLGVFVGIMATLTWYFLFHRDSVEFHERLCVPVFDEERERIEMMTRVAEKNSEEYSLGSAFVAMDCGKLSLAKHLLLRMMVKGDMR